MDATIKICGVMTVGDARVVTDSGADMLGVVLAPSVRRVEPERARAIFESVEGRVTRVAVFRDQSPSEIRATLATLAVEAVQVHGPLDDALRDELRARGTLVIKALHADDVGLADFVDEMVDAVLIDGPRPGTGAVHGFDILDQRSFSVPVIVAGGLDAHNVAAVVAATGARGVDCASGVESAPGVKDPVRVAAFVAASRAALATRRGLR